jgi:hypothetical protein
VVTATKSILIGNRRFNISGVGENDPYFSAITDTFEPEFTRICNDFVCDDYVCVDIGANIGIKTLLLDSTSRTAALSQLKPRQPWPASSTRTSTAAA